MGLYGDADLVLTQDVPYTRSLQYLVNATAINWSLYTRAIRLVNYAGAVVGDLSAYATPRTGATTFLDLVIPRAAISTFWHDSRWDLVAVLNSDPTQSFRTPQPAGRVIVLSGPTDV